MENQIAIIRIFGSGQSGRRWPEHEADSPEISADEYPESLRVDNDGIPDATVDAWCIEARVPIADRPLFEESLDEDPAVVSYYGLEVVDS